MDEIWQQISRRGAVRTGQNLAFDKWGPYIRANIGELLTQGVFLGNRGLPGKHFSNAFLVHRLAERDKIWHNEGHLYVAGHRLFWWTLVHVSGSRNFRQRISRTLLVGMRRNLAVLGVWQMDTYLRNLVNFGPGVPRYHAATCISPSLMHLFSVWLTEPMRLIARKDSSLKRRVMCRTICSTLLIRSIAHPFSIQNEKNTAWRQTSWTDKASCLEEATLPFPSAQFPSSVPNTIPSL